jgi:FkbM family methyltransferase
MFRRNKNSVLGNNDENLDFVSLDFVNTNLPDILRKQGKGWGSSTTKEEVSAILELSRFDLNKDLVVFDIGANIGLYTESVIEKLPNAQVFAFEPSKKAFSILTSKFQDNSRVNLINSAVGSTNGSTSLYADESGSGMASLTKRRMDHFGLEFEFQEEVNILMLDKWCEEKSIWADIIKMDVEGHELDVLQSGTQAVKKATAIQFEFGGCNIDTRTYFQDFWYFFKDFNFQIWRITPSGLDPIQRYSEYDECFTTTNYIAIKDPLGL